MYRVLQLVNIVHSTNNSLYESLNNKSHAHYCKTQGEWKTFFLLFYQGSRDDLSVGGGTGGVTRHGNSVDASFSKEVLNSITGSRVWCVCSCLFLASILKGVNEDINAYYPPRLHQSSHPWLLPRVTRPTLGVLWSVWTPTLATVTGTVRRWTDVRRWEEESVKKT